MPSEELIKEIDNVLTNDIVDRHSFFQLKHFVLGKECSFQGRMWQCLREIRSRKSWIEGYIIEIADAKDRIELLNIEQDQNTLNLKEFEESTSISEERKNLAAREYKVKSRQIDRKVQAVKASIEALEKKIADYEEEANFYISEFKQIVNVEPLKPLDDLDAQKEYWTAKLYQDINLKMLLQQPLDLETVKMILTLNDDSVLKQQMVALLEGNRKAIQAEATKKLQVQ
jgi:hypothetical protein